MDVAMAVSTWPNLSSEFNFRVNDSLQSWTHFEVQKGRVNSSENTHLILNQFIKKQMFLSNTVLLLKHLFIACLQPETGFFCVDFCCVFLRKEGEKEKKP